MKLNLNKAFQPCEVDVEDEMFPNGIFEFNITKLLAHVKADPDDFPIEEAAVATLGLTSTNLDEATVQGANLQVPIVLAEIAPGRFDVVDGNHRAERARRHGTKTLPAYRVGPDVHHRFLTSAEAYKSSVAYWNEKLKARKPAPYLAFTASRSCAPGRNFGTTDAGISMAAPV